MPSTFSVGVSSSVPTLVSEIPAVSTPGRSAEAEKLRSSPSGSRKSPVPIESFDLGAPRDLAILEGSLGRYRRPVGLPCSGVRPGAFALESRERAHLELIGRAGFQVRHG